ncbi:MAG: histidine kinase [Alphaproteobacteria bacterium]|nr:histidine kinase [Alphaproteobacteria bacterium]
MRIVSKHIVFHIVGAVIFVFLIPYIFSIDHNNNDRENFHEKPEFKEFRDNQPHRNTRNETFLPQPPKGKPPHGKPMEIKNLYQQKVNTNIVIIIFFYLNLYYLFPKYWIRKKYALWLLWIMVGATLTFIVPMMLNGRLGRNKPFLADLQICLFLYFTVILISMLWKEFSLKNEIQIQKTAAELQAIKLQMNPHFLFNSLNSIYSLTLTQNEKAPHSILILSQLLRYVLTEGNLDKISLNHEAAFILNFIDFQKIRLGNTADIHFDTHIETNNLDVAPLLFLPFLENAFKYGIIPDQRSYIKFELKTSDKTIFFLAKNDINPKQSSGTQVGLKSIRKRLQLLYPNQHTLTIDKTETYFMVTLKLWG